jgi:phage shock protein A
MSYFSRLTDIVTCNLSALLAEADDPVAALQDIIAEMREGLAGARRSVATATASEQRLAGEIDEYRRQAEYWDGKARSELLAAREGEARNCLLRKKELQDLIAGLEHEHRAAQATKDHLTTMFHALEARLAEALRRQEEMGQVPPLAASAAVDFGPPSQPHDDIHRHVDDELEALKRQLGLT